MTPIKKFARWLWLKVTGEDPIVVAGHFNTLSSLNGCHVRFIEQLEKDHPELKSLIEEHQKERVIASEPTLRCDKCKLLVRSDLYETVDGDVCADCNRKTPWQNRVTDFWDD